MDFIGYMFYNTLQYIKSDIYRHTHTVHFYIHRE